MNELPEITQQPILGIDATPDADYPLRILRAYRENCNCRWRVSGDIDSDPVIDMMNLNCEERAAILDRAIEILERAGRPC